MIIVLARSILRLGVIQLKKVINTNCRVECFSNDWSLIFLSNYFKYQLFCENNYLVSSSMR